MAQVKAVIFDAFGTVLQIHKGCHPYRQLLKLGMTHGRRLRSDDAAVIMSLPLDLAGAAAHFGITINSNELQRIQQALKVELEAIKPFTDAVSSIQNLREQGIKVAICSNLAMPYQEAVERHFPGLDGYGYSFQVGALKPAPLIYHDVLKQLDVAPEQTWMIGDSQRCDRDGPAALGIRGHYLQRTDHPGTADYAELTSFAHAVLSHNR